jgi:hypothetical protein
MLLGHDEQYRLLVYVHPLEEDAAVVNRPGIV